MGHYALGDTVRTVALDLEQASVITKRKVAYLHSTIHVQYMAAKVNCAVTNV